MLPTPERKSLGGDTPRPARGGRPLDPRFGRALHSPGDFSGQLDKLLWFLYCRDALQQGEEILKVAFSISPAKAAFRWPIYWESAIIIAPVALSTLMATGGSGWVAGSCTAAPDCAGSKAAPWQGQSKSLLPGS